MGLRPQQGLFSDCLSLMLGNPPVRLNYLKTSPRFLFLGLNPVIDSISLTVCNLPSLACSTVIYAQMQYSNMPVQEKEGAPQPC